MLESIKQKRPFIKELAQRYGYYKNEHFKKTIRSKYGCEHQNLRFYIIGGVVDETAGLFAFVKAIFLHAAYAKEHGYTPVVDMQNFPNQYQKANTIHDNVWEIFFKQPDNYHLYNIKKSRNIIFSKPFSRPSYKASQKLQLKRLTKNASALREEFKQYIKLSAPMQEVCTQKAEELLGKHRVLGVLCRGTDYLLKKPKYHPIQPDVDQLIAEAREVMQAQQCTKLFLASEDVEVVAKFKAEFGAKLITNQQRLYNADELAQVSYLSEIAENNKIEIAKEYLVSVYMLSKCSCFIAGHTAGSVGAYLFSDGYEYDHIWDLGTYN
ncbi:MAG: hypothetical protein ACK5JS_06380 [Mangrovibacterium sp.]